jgi:hypothetical protein
MRRISATHRLVVALANLTGLASCVAFLLLERLSGTAVDPVVRRSCPTFFQKMIAPLRRGFFIFAGMESACPLHRDDIAQRYGVVWACSDAFLLI